MKATFTAPQPMHISEIFAQSPTTFSFEFFPPKTPESAEKLYGTITELEAYQPNFVSVTYGAGGTTREMTHDLVIRIKEKGVLDPIPHLTCVCHSEAEVHDILTRYAAAGVSNLLALRGDPPRDHPNYDRANDAFAYAAVLVKFIKRFNDQGTHPHPKGFGVGVAGFPEGHPLTPNRLLEMDHLKAKVDAGADYICTQLFFDNNDFYDFRERCDLAGIHVPIVAGIMPITTTTGMRRMAELSAGSRFPARLLKALARAGDHPDSIRRVGLHYATEQCADLLNHKVAGIHFYTLNQSNATREIYANLGLRSQGA